MNEAVSINDLTTKSTKDFTKELTNDSTKDSTEDIKKSSEDSCSIAADIAQVVQKTNKNSQEKNEHDVPLAPQIVQIQRLQEKPYRDTISEQYIMFRNDYIGSPANTHGEEATKTIHHIIHATGELPLW